MQGRSDAVLLRMCMSINPVRLELANNLQGTTKVKQYILLDRLCAASIKRWPGTVRVFEKMRKWWCRVLDWLQEEPNACSIGIYHASPDLDLGSLGTDLT